MARDSEIFDNYIKIALEKGIVSNNAPLRKGAEKKSKVDSSDISAIEALYGVKPKGDKALEYKNNIMEVAHPKSVVLTQSYDKMNSLIENNIERQRIMLNIVTKMPNGHLTAKKYAESDLVHSLIRVANEMDNKDIDSLRILADTCSEQIKKRADFMDDMGKYLGQAKEWLTDKSKDAVDVGGAAGVGGIIGGVLGGLVGVFGGPVGMVGGTVAGAALAGLVSSIFKTSPQAKNVAINSDIAVKELQDIIVNFPQDTMLNKFNTALQGLSVIAKQYATLVDQMHSESSLTVDKNAVEEIAKKYLGELVRVKNMISVFLTATHAGRYEVPENQYLSKIKSPLDVMIGNNLHDEEGALSALLNVIEKAIADVNNVQKEALSFKDKVETKPSAPEVAPAPVTIKEDASLFNKFLGK